MHVMKRIKEEILLTFHGGLLLSLDRFLLFSANFNIDISWNNAASHNKK